MIDPAQGELGDAAHAEKGQQREAGPRQAKGHLLPSGSGPFLGYQPAQVQPDFHVLCRDLVIVVEQVENQSPTVGFPSQLAQHVTAWLQAEARSSGRGFGARRNFRLAPFRP